MARKKGAKKESIKPVEEKTPVEEKKPAEEKKPVEGTADSKDSKLVEEVRASFSYKRCFSGDNFFIVVAGIIGAGKTTLVTSLAKKLDFDPAFEPVIENPYLPSFYEGMKLPVNPQAFPMQVFLLGERFGQHQEIVWKKRNTIQDRSIYEDPIFAKMLAKSGKMSKLDFDTYRALFLRMTNFLHRPDLIIFLETEPEEALRRIRTRGRECEKDIPLGYLQALNEEYHDWLEHDVAGRIPVLKVDWNTFKTTEWVIERIQEKMDNPIFNSLLKM